MCEIVRMAAALHGAVKMPTPLTKWNALTLMNVKGCYICNFYKLPIIFGSLVGLGGGREKIRCASSHIGNNAENRITYDLRIIL